MATALLQRTSVNGTELAYDVRGTGEPVVLVHGGIVADAFGPLVAEPGLAARYRLVRYHRRGYGQSARTTAAVGIAEQAADCRELLLHLGIARAHVVGYSIGGAIGLQLALDAPEAVHSLALLEPTIPAAVTDAAALEYFLGTIGQAFERYGAGDRAGAIETWASGAFGPGYRAELERAIPGAFQQAVDDAEALFQLDAPALQGWRFGPEVASRVRQPVLVVSHDDPRWAGFRMTAEALRAWLPRAEGLDVATATHLLQMVEPGAVAAGLAAFFARHPISGPSGQR